MESFARSEEIELFGKKYLLTQRIAMDTLDLIEFTERKLRAGTLTRRAQTFISAMCVSKGLEYNWRRLSHFSIKRIKLKWLFRAKRLMKKLSLEQLNTLSEKVLELEGVDFKKKVKEAEKDLTEESLKI